MTHSRSLGLYLAICFSLLSLLLTLILVAVIDVTVTKQAKASIGASLAELSYQMSYRLDRAMFERYREVQLMAERIGTDSRAVREPVNRRALDSLQRTYPHYAWMGAADHQGQVLVATRGVLEGSDVSARPWFQNALKEIHVGDVHEAKLLAKLLPNTTGAPLRFVDIAFPYAGADGRVQGVLGAHLSWEWAKTIEQSITEPVGKEREVEALILSADNKVLLGPADLEGQTLALQSLQGFTKGARGFYTERLPDGNDYLVGISQGSGYADYPGLGWKVIMRQPLDNAYLPVKQLHRQVFLIGILVASVFSLLGFWVARAITRPIKLLSHSAQRLESGEHDAINAIGAIDPAYTEVSALGRSLNSLIRNLQQKEADLKDLNATLEHRVAQRTLELTQALQNVRDNENRINTIVETAQDAFIGVNFQGRITDWNSQAEVMLGWRRDEMLGQPLERLVPERFAGSIRKAMQVFASTGKASFVNTKLERLVQTRDSGELAVEVRVGLINNSKLNFFSAFLRDISERKQVERMKSEFISTASHELRTPLTAIYGSLSLINSGMAGDLPPDAKELVDISYRSAERLVLLINDILDVEKIESHSMVYHRAVLPLLPLLAESIRATQGYADQYQVKFELVSGSGEETLVWADAGRLTQVMVNLLSNAAKFSPSGGAVVTVSLRRGADSVRVLVTDAGMGIAEDFRSRIFQRFAQSDGSDRRQKGGTGLGLNICKSIIEAHRGRIDFVSEPGKGSTFYFDLPLAG
ncbi:HAMP domain-containing histidine kinase [Polaromonas glacialis]|uniref:HAMP domain-containing histidine kinase n=1 Tax=Polaromonas glacialis TaxID=866564 RepID=UPI000496378F|nr:HAMP domain-containing histidine kinase [Polaromonas glacialis]